MSTCCATCENKNAAFAATIMPPPSSTADNLEAEEKQHYVVLWHDLTCHIRSVVGSSRCILIFMTRIAASMDLSVVVVVCTPTMCMFRNTQHCCLSETRCRVLPFLQIPAKTLLRGKRRDLWPSHHRRTHRKHRQGEQSNAIPFDFLHPQPSHP